MENLNATTASRQLICHISGLGNARVSWGIAARREILEGLLRGDRAGLKTGSDVMLIKQPNGEYIEVKVWVTSPMLEKAEIEAQYAFQKVKAFLVMENGNLHILPSEKAHFDESSPLVQDGIWTFGLYKGTVDGTLYVRTTSLVAIPVAEEKPVAVEKPKPARKSRAKKEVTD